MSTQRQKDFYRYYQTEEDGVWTPIRSEEFENRRDLIKAKKVTILEVSEIVSDDSDRNNRSYSYRGPLYFDIDCKSNLDMAIESARTMAEKLIQLGVPKRGIEIYASGSKGIHLLVPQRYFSSGRAVKALPLIYKEMAKELYVPGLDFQVYSCGKGNAFRIVNERRADGRYRVPILLEELETLKAEDYAALCSAPRNLSQLEATPPGEKIPEMEAMFERCRRQVNSLDELKVISVSDEEILEIGKNVPACVQQIADYKFIKPEKNFNQVAMQLGVYIARSGVSPVVADGLMNRLASNGHSSQYDSLKTRMNHIRAQVAYMQSSKQYRFGCNLMRAHLSKAPCKGCPLEGTSGSATSDTFDLIERDDGYYRRGVKEDYRLTNFLIEPSDHFVDVPQDGSSPKRIGTKIEFVSNHEVLATTVFNEASWNSKSTLLKELEGFGNRHALVFRGTDNDALAIKNHVIKKGIEMGEVYQVYTCGVHLDFVRGREVFTYVEPGMSINSNRVQNTHQMASSLVARPYFFESKVCEVGDSLADEALFNMLSANATVELALMVGWFSACHLRTHLMHLYSQFPVLAVSGQAGSGKSATVGLISWLNGTDYFSRDSGVNVSSITPYAALEYAASTTTVPRVMEEYNKSKIRQEYYKFVGEMIKASWNSETMLRGGLADKTKKRGRTGGIVHEIPITSPLVVISEQELEMPALRERSLMIHLSKSLRKDRQSYFRFAASNRAKLREIGKALMIKAIQTPTAEVAKLMDKAETLLSFDLDDRPRYSFAVAMVGLEFFLQTVSSDLDLPMSSTKLEEMRIELTSYYAKLGERSEEVGARTEVDAVMVEISLMAALSRSSSNLPQRHQWLSPGEHYLYTGDYLFLDIAVVHTLYRNFSSTMERGQPVIQQASEFQRLLKDEPYFVDIIKDDNLCDGRKMSKLDCELMRKKGIDPTLFERS
jgi:hypothetical protein